MPFRLSDPRLLLALVILSGTSPNLPAAFTLKCVLPHGGADSHVEVLRESLEARASTSVISTRIPGPQFELKVPSEAGLFTLIVGDAKGAFVASENQVITVTAGSDGKSLLISGTPDQDAYLAYEAFRASSLARLVLSVREAARTARQSGDRWPFRALGSWIYGNTLLGCVYLSYVHSRQFPDAPSLRGVR